MNARKPAMRRRCYVCRKTARYHQIVTLYACETHRTPRHRTYRSHLLRDCAHFPDENGQAHGPESVPS